MDKRDVLVGDMRVTALSPDGPYYFEWVEKNETVKLAKECKFDTVTDEVATVINQHGLTIVGNEGQTDDTNVEKSNNLLSDNYSTVQTTKKNNKTDDNTDDNETVSFIVRMDNAKEREKTLQMFKEKYPDEVSKLQLSGPYKITYDLSNSDIELIQVEDLGTGLKLN